MQNGAIFSKFYICKVTNFEAWFYPDNNSNKPGYHE